VTLNHHVVHSFDYRGRNKGRRRIALAANHCNRNQKHVISLFPHTGLPTRDYSTMCRVNRTYSATFFSVPSTRLLRALQTWTTTTTTRT
jgi:hypothetical protein